MKILFFGSLGERIGSTAKVEMPQGGCTIADLRQALVRQNPDAATYLATSAALVAVNQNMVPESFLVTPDQEVAFFPVLSGG
jgi:molybdopterin converting factor small subunit